ncbi:T9SS type A sorting domain-containing protein [Chryseobacterium chendengshani]|uniref:T9SS type A sorting domain-containing protein n=1 Tax=Chryseobacterium sp. LJ756 TaxID=2864113 RepID=UPI001C63C9A1|nr:T9SS type A sorting domain-containing protein [Chryseobacterium sp. LJ756]MBW7675451.1 T9SS type A sorting domain-containing protein [Chryseobacterium sp. LJ756]
MSCLSFDAQTILTQNFEGSTFPPTGWTRSSTNATRAWDLSTVNFSGTTPTAIDLRDKFTITGSNSATLDWVAAANTANLTSPSFSLVGASSPILKFNVVVGWSYMIDSDDGDLVAQVSTNGGTLWTTLWDEDTEPGFTDDGDLDEDTDLYNTVAVQRSLSAYIGQADVRIRFQYVGNNADAVAIDDVQVLAGTLSTNDIANGKTNSISIYPNPTKGEINIKTDKKIKSSTVFDLSGKVLLQTDSQTVNISSFTKGTYLLKVEFADGSTKTEKVIKD